MIEAWSGGLDRHFQDARAASSDDVAGLAALLAARIMSRAEAREILVSGTVRDLVIGSDLTFSDRGDHELKGIPVRWSLFAAT